MLYLARVHEFVLNLSYELLTIFFNLLQHFNNVYGRIETVLVRCSLFIPSLETNKHFVWKFRDKLQNHRIMCPHEYYQTIRTLQWPFDSSGMGNTIETSYKRFYKLASLIAHKTPNTWNIRRNPSLDNKCLKRNSSSGP